MWIWLGLACSSTEVAAGGDDTLSTGASESDADTDADTDGDKDGDGFTDAEEAKWKSDPADPYSWPYESGQWPDFTDEAKADGISGVGYAIGDEIPDVTFTDQHGNSVQIYDFYGHVILLAVVAAWSGPDIAFTQTLPDLWTDNRADGFVVIEVLWNNAQGNDATASDVSTWAAAYGLDFPAVIESPPEIYNDFSRAGTFEGYVPSYVLIDRDMVIDSYYTGFGGSDHEDRLAELLVK